MYSLNTRINAIFFFGVGGIVVLAVFNILTTIFLTPLPKIAKFTVNPNFSLYKNPYTKVQHSRSSFSLDVDFSPVINWNNHILFVWMTATYSTGKTNKITSVTLFDQIIPRDQPDKYHLNINEELFEYPIVDAYSTLGGKEVLIKLHWEHMPVIGPILKYEHILGAVNIPETQNKPLSSVVESEYHYYDLNAKQNDNEDDE